MLVQIQPAQNRTLLFVVDVHIKKRGVFRTLGLIAWSAMKQRCNNPSASHWDKYGGRGIKYCNRWEQFTAFLEDMGDRPLGKSIDRINNDGNYEPGNCRWATQSEQLNNRGNNHVIERDGVRHTIAEWSEISGISAETIRVRHNRKWPVEKIFQTSTKTPYQNREITRNAMIPTSPNVELD